jgi:hypothetical protein
MGGANLISYADSDFESGVGNWAGISNAVLTQDTSEAFLHNASLRDVLGAAGDSEFDLGAGAQINVTGNGKYRAGAYFKAPAQPGLSVTWAVQAFGSDGTPQGWTSGTPVALNDSGGWQYASDVIQMPSGAAYLLGSPRVTFTGGAAREAVNMDEVQFTPYRAAELIGADGGHSGSAAEWGTANNTIGPLQSDKIFYRTLPASYTGSTCDQLPAAAACFINYKTMDVNLASFVSSIPASRAVVMIYHSEPEGKTFSYQGLTGAAAFVAEFGREAGMIRSAAHDAPDIFTAMDAASYGYHPGGPGVSCGYIPPPSYVDFYLIDQYQRVPNGSQLSQSTGRGPVGWANWLKCVSGYGKPIGLGEYGLGACGQNNLAMRDASIAASEPYLEKLPGSSVIDAPVLVWSYWWVDETGRHSNHCDDWQFTVDATIKAWHAVEAAR